MRQERISINIERTGVLFTACATKRIYGWPDLYVGKPDVFQHFLPACTRQATGDSGRP